MRFLLFVLIASLCHQASSIAQEPSKRTCRILFLAAPADAPKTLFLSDGGTAQEIELPSMNFSKVYALAPGDITLTMLAAKPVPNEPLPAAAPKAVVREAQQNLYLLVASDPANKIAPVRFQVINADADGFKTASCCGSTSAPTSLAARSAARPSTSRPMRRPFSRPRPTKAEITTSRSATFPPAPSARNRCVKPCGCMIPGPKMSFSCCPWPIAGSRGSWDFPTTARLRKSGEALKPQSWFLTAEPNRPTLNPLSQLPMPETGGIRTGNPQKPASKPHR